MARACSHWCSYSGAARRWKLGNRLRPSRFESQDQQKNPTKKIIADRDTTITWLSLACFAWQIGRIFFFLLLTWLNQRSSESYRANNAPYECTSKPLPQVSLVTGLTTTTGRRQWYSSAQARKPLLKVGQVFAIICHCSTIDLWPRLRPYQVISRPLIEQAARY